MLIRLVLGIFIMVITSAAFGLGKPYPDRQQIYMDLMDENHPEAGMALFVKDKGPNSTHGFICKVKPENKMDALSLIELSRTKNGFYINDIGQHSAHLVVYAAQVESDTSRRSGLLLKGNLDDSCNFPSFQETANPDNTKADGVK